MFFQGKSKLSPLVSKIIEFSKDKPDAWNGFWQGEIFGFQTKNKFSQKTEIFDTLLLFEDGTLKLKLYGKTINPNTGETTEEISIGWLVPELTSTEKTSLRQTFVKLSHEKILRGIERAEIATEKK